LVTLDVLIQIGTCTSGWEPML